MAGYGVNRRMFEFTATRRGRDIVPAGINGPSVPQIRAERPVAEFMAAHVGAKRPKISRLTLDRARRRQIDHDAQRRIGAHRDLGPVGHRVLGIDDREG